jgi:HEAT repeat protein
VRIAAIHRAGLICVCAMLVAAWPAAGQNATDKVDAALRSSLAEQREWALDQIIETHDARPGLTPRLAQLLDDSDLDVAGKAATALSLRGVDAFPAIDELLKTGSAQQRWGATVALYKSTADIARFLPTLTKQLSAEDELLVRASLAALARLQTRAAPAVSALKPLLSRDDSRFAGRRSQRWRRSAPRRGMPSRASSRSCATSRSSCVSRRLMP